MIFITVGTQLPFDRLVKAVDNWAGDRTNVDILAQIGNNASEPSNMGWIRHLEPDEFREACEKCHLMVAHAGIGTILIALELAKPIIVMPRRAALGEHRSNHQLATAKWLESEFDLKIAWNQCDLKILLSNYQRQKIKSSFGPWASTTLLSTIREFIDKD